MSEQKFPCRGRHGGRPGREDCRAHYETMATPEKLLFILTRLGHIRYKFFGGKGGQLRLLHLLRESGGMTQRELTERMDVQPGSASEIIKKLENAGLITRTVHENDRRTADIRLTELGLEEARRFELRRAAQTEDFFSVLSPEEQEQLLVLFEKLDEDWKTRFRDKRKCGEEAGTCGGAEDQSKEK